jgi:hypothetical protein
MSKKSLTGLALGLLAAACAGGPGVAAPDLEAVDAYYAEHPLPSEWRLLDISNHNNNAIVSVAVSGTVCEDTLGGSIRSYLACYATVCPPQHHPLWHRIDQRRDIVIERVENGRQNAPFSCRQHGPRS